MDQDNRIDDLIAKLAAGTLTDEELAALVAWYNDFDDTEVTLTVGGSANAEQLKARMYGQLMEKVKPTGNVKRPLLMRLLPYAAAILVVGVGAWYFADNRSIFTGGEPDQTAGIAPSGNRATLTLADGRTVNLSGEHTGIAVGEALTYLDGSAVSADRLIEQADNSINRLTLSTPRGGTYQIALPDGTQVWLNSASKLKYPSRFDGPDRVVELEGEAYFEVSERLSTPFKVISQGQTVEVLGTQFNIAAYADRPETKTTLVDGSVRIAPTTAHGPAVTIKPGQQATLRGPTIAVQTVDINQYIAWKQGIFYFESTPLEEMLDQLSRWYDVEVTYPRGIPHETFTGKFRRDVSLKGMVDILRLSMVDIKLEKGTLIVDNLKK